MSASVTFECQVIECRLTDNGGAILKMCVPPSAIQTFTVYPRLCDAHDNCLPVRVTLFSDPRCVELSKRKPRG